ncbi:MAG: phosphomannomutase/phosphoglucomutase [Pyrinomonadaceae bacterium]
MVENRRVASVDKHIFREYDIRGIVGTQLTDEAVATVSRAIGTYLRRHGANKIAVGCDARDSSPRFLQLITAGLNASGCNVVDIGMVPTPVLYQTLFTKDVDGGVMITGSHNPADHNGFKVCLGRDALFGEQIREIGEIAATGAFGTGGGSRENLNVLDDYKRDIAAGISLGPRRLRVVVDAGNGMGGITAVPIYRELGMDVIELYTDPDPTFPNHHADPTVEENLQDLIAAVKENKADLGIAFDGDGDRIGIVDETGRIIWGDVLTILFARSVLAANPGATVIGEVKCSQTLFDEIERLGGTPIMSKAGHSIIKAKMKETGALLAGEMSGHIFFADRFYGFDDACYAGVRLIEILSKTDRPLSALLSEIPERFSTPELRVACPDAIKFDVVAQIASHFARDHQVNTTDGARITYPHGWGLVRPSNTQAIIVMRFEADTDEHLQAIKSAVTTAVNDLISKTG